jgi:hypothetical protein
MVDESTVCPIPDKEWIPVTDLDYFDRLLERLLEGYADGTLEICSTADLKEQDDGSIKITCHHFDFRFGVR